MKNNVYDFLHYFFVGSASSIACLLGTFDTTLEILITFIIIDYITGVMRGYVTKTLSSKIGSRGLVKKGSIFLVLIMAVSLDKLLGDKTLLRTMVAYFYIFNEGISLLENLSQIGVPIPSKLKEALTKVNDLSGSQNITSNDSQKEEEVK